MSDRPIHTDELARMMAHVLSDLPASSSASVAAAPASHRRGGGSIESNQEEWLSPHGSSTVNTSGTFHHEHVSPLFVDTQNVSGPTVNLTSSSTGPMDNLMSSRSGMTEASTAYTSSYESQVSVSGGYSVFVFPEEQFTMNDICCHKVGYGETICVRLHCETQHRGEKALLQPGTIAVSKNKSVVFAEPITNKQFIHDDVLKVWRSNDYKRSLDTWKELFSVTNAAEIGDKISLENLKAAQSFMDLAKDYKSPPNHKVVNLVSPRIATLNVTPSEFQSEENSFLELMTSDPLELVAKRKAVADLSVHEGSRKKILLGEDDGYVADAIMTLEKDIEIGDARVYAIASKLDAKEMFFSNEVKVLLTRLESVEGTIGGRILTGDSPYQTPTIWGSVAALASNLENCYGQQTDLTNQLHSELLGTTKSLQNYIDATVQQAIDNFNGSITALKSRVQQVMTENQSHEQNILSIARGNYKMKEDLRTINQCVLDHTLDSQLHNNGGVAAQNTPGKLDELLEKINFLSEQVTQLRSENDLGDSVKFFGLGFREPKEAESWAVANLGECSYGFVVDAHLVLEHINTLTSESESTLTRLHTLHKLRLENLTQGLAISSFETRVPKFFSKSSSVSSTSIKKSGGGSHFDQIPTFDDWDQPITGFRDRLHEELVNFERSHSRMIDDTLSVDSKAYNICKLSVTESVGWIIQLVKYMDSTYKELVRFNTFSEDKAWLLTTQLTKRIFMETSLPRQGTQNRFSVGENANSGKLTLWPIVKSLDIMQRYKDAQFKDDPSIASEYVKFLAANSGNEATTKLTTRMGTIESEVKSVLKVVSGFEKGNNQNLNKVDEVNKRLTEIQKRLTKLEGQKN